MNYTTVVVYLFCFIPAFHSQAFTERSLVNMFCQGVSEYRLPDKTRIDCLTETHAIEFDFDRKWAEAIGQSLFYAQATQKKAGIYLIIEKSPSSHLTRLKKPSKLMA